MKQAEKKQDPDMLDEYDFTGGVRGKYAARYAAGVTVTVKKKARRRKLKSKPSATGQRGLSLSSSPPRFPLEDRKVGLRSSHYVEVTT